jgi:hypothetical protein
MPYFRLPPSGGKALNVHAPRPEIIEPSLLLLAYRGGIFPMADARDDPDIFWVEPKNRGILPLDGFRCSHSLARSLRRGASPSPATQPLPRWWKPAPPRARWKGAKGPKPGSASASPPAIASCTPRATPIRSNAGKPAPTARANWWAASMAWV